MGLLAGEIPYKNVETIELKGDVVMINKEKEESVLKKYARRSKHIKKSKSLHAATRGRLCFAFDFGAFATKIAIVKVTKSKLEFRKLLTVENDSSTYEVGASDVKGLEQRIARALKRTGITASGHLGLCTVGVNHYITRLLEIPFVEERERQGLVAYEMGRSLSLDVDTYFFQHIVQKVYEKNGRQMCSVWVTALPKERCEAYYSLLEALKLKPLTLDINVNGMMRFFKKDTVINGQVSNAVVATVDLGRTGTEVSMYTNGMYTQGGFIPIGEEHFVSDVRAVLGVSAVDVANPNKLTVRPQEVYNILHQTKTSESARAFACNVEAWISEINTEIKRSYIHSDSETVSHLYLYGGSLQLVWLRPYLEKVLGIPTTVIHKSACYPLPDKIPQLPNTIPQFLNTLNLFLSS